MKTLNRSRRPAHGRGGVPRGELAVAPKAAVSGRLGKRRAHASGCGMQRNTRPPEMGGQAQRVVARLRPAGGRGVRSIRKARPVQQAAKPFLAPFRARMQHACAANKLTQLNARASLGVTNITFRVSGQRGGSSRAMGMRPARRAVRGARTSRAETNRFAARHRLRLRPQRTAVDRFRNCTHQRGPGSAATPGRRALPKIFVRMKKADGHWGTTGQQPVRDLAIDMPAHPARPTGEQ